MPKSYNYQIDILRALAVFLVIFNHLNITIFQGGFIGVDIFLVISGFLITKNIINEQDQTNKIAIKSFYERRIVRLAPAFFTVIITCLIVFSIVLTQDELNSFLQSVLASISLTSNIYFSTQLNDYFHINAYSTPLLHIWSLSLEEQFYLIWPFILILIFKTKKNLYLIFFSIFILISLTISEFLSQSQPIFAYYLLPSRFFEFCIGALIAVMPLKRANRHTIYILIIISLLVILASSFVINKFSKFPSYNALIPCIATAIIIYLSQQFHHKIRLLEPIYYLGKISYPMYLWHWPIIVYLSLYSISLTPLVCIIVILFTIICSSLTYEIIEKRAKKYSITSKQNIKVFFLFPVCLVTAISLFLINVNTSNPQTIQITSEPTIKCVDQLQHPLAECTFGNISNENIDVLLVGDSHANSLSGFVDIIAKDANLKGYEITHSSTAFLLNTERHIQINSNQDFQKIDDFKNLNNFKRDLILNNKFKFVVISGYFPDNWKRNIYTTQDSLNANQKNSLINFRKGFDASIELILKTNALPIIINDTPLLSNIDINCNLRNPDPLNQCYVDRHKHEEMQKEWKYELTRLEKKYKELIIIDLTNTICDKMKCYSYINTTPLYRDSQHLTYSGSKEIATKYLQNHKNPFK
jgi:peptidoglycan/LPS O-acetylase OafA/YrhL